MKNKNWFIPIFIIAAIFFGELQEVGFQCCVF